MLGGRDIARRDIARRDVTRWRIGGRRIGDRYVARHVLRLIGGDVRKGIGGRNLDWSIQAPVPPATARATEESLRARTLGRRRAREMAGWVEAEIATTREREVQRSDDDGHNPRSERLQKLPR
jgi:hypothetical protein